MSFNRSRVQLQCENFLNCNTLEQWNSTNIKELILDKGQAYILRLELIKDTIDLYYKGIVSLFETIKSINEGRYSWATIQSYYGTYYFLRATMGVFEVALIRNKSLFFLKCRENESPHKKGNKKYNSDHSGTIHHFLDLFGNVDELSSQNIEDNNVYDWLMNKREQVNYRERNFHEPNAPVFFNEIKTRRDNGELEDLLKELIEDNYIKIFQPEYAVLSIPLKRAIVTRDKMRIKGIDLGFDKEKREFLRNLFPYRIEKLDNLYA